MPQRQEARTNGGGGDGDGDRRGSPSPRIAEEDAEEEEEEEEDRRRHKRTIGRAMRSLSKKIHGRRRRMENRAQPPPAPEPPEPPPPRRSASPDIGGGGGYRRSSCLCFNPNPGRYPPDSPLITPNPSGDDPKVTRRPSTYHEFVRFLLENNDFYSRDCNVHRDITPHSDDP